MFCLLVCGYKGGYGYSLALHNTIPVYISQNLYGHILPTNIKMRNIFMITLVTYVCTLDWRRFFDLKFLFQMFFYELVGSV